MFSLMLAKAVATLAAAKVMFFPFAFQDHCLAAGHQPATHRIFLEDIGLWFLFFLLFPPCSGDAAGKEQSIEKVKEDDQDNDSQRTHVMISSMVLFRSSTAIR
jgi:hypothetical protein